MIKHLFLVFLLGIVLYSKGQYAPAVGQASTTAVHKDSSSIIAWASQSTIFLGWQNIADQSLGKTTTGDQYSPLGMADNDVISLGDGGSAIIQFANAIANGPGPDFAVFENSFDNLFLELAFVEVSSDGQNYFRFPAHSLTQTSVQVGSFGQLQATQINNLAGKYRGGYGTPFDLEELNAIPGLDIMHITHVKIIDVVGSINDAYASFDTASNKINDPFPTPFPIGGFDLDAVGVLHLATSIGSLISNYDMLVYPNPCNNYLNIEISYQSELEILSLQGQILHQERLQIGVHKVDIQGLAKGVYLLKLITNSGIYIRRIVKN